MPAHRSGHRFVELLQSGKISFDMDYPKLSSWTIKRDTAQRFATKAPAGSSYMAMTQMLRSKGQIQGRLGIVMSTLAKPEEILVDMSRIDVHGQHGNEGEMILLPSKKKIRVVEIWTPEGLMTVDQYREYAGRDQES